MNQEYIDLLYLIRCAVLEENPTRKLKTEISIIYKLAKFHSIENFLLNTVIKIENAEKEVIGKWKNSYDKYIRRQLNLEDLYIYLLSHEIKHYEYGGIGLKALIDLYYFDREYSKQIDFSKIDDLLEKLGYLEYEKRRKNIVQSLFYGNEEEIFSILEDKLLYQYCNSGTFGNFSNHIENQLTENSSVKNYYKNRLFPSDEWLKDYHPYIYKYKILKPFYFTYRLIKGLFKKKSWKELSLVLKNKFKKK